MVLVQHLHIVGGSTVLRIGLVEGLVPPLEQVQLGEVKSGVMLFVDGAVHLAQHALRSWPALSRELAVEDVDLAPRRRARNLGRVTLAAQVLLHHAGVVPVDRALDVPAFVLVRIAAVEHGEGGDLAGVLASHQRRHRVDADALEVGMLAAADHWQREELGEVAGEVAVVVGGDGERLHDGQVAFRVAAVDSGAGNLSGRRLGVRKLSLGERNLWKTLGPARFFGGGRVPLPPLNFRDVWGYGGRLGALKGGDRQRRGTDGNRFLALDDLGFARLLNNHGQKRHYLINPANKS